MNEYMQTVGTNVMTSGTLKDLVIEGIAKIGDKVGGYHKEEGKIGCKLGSYEEEADFIFLEDYGMMGINVRESVVS
jgi:hypothetical protein